MNRSFSIVIVRPSPRIRHGEVRAAAIMLRPLARGVQREREQTPASTEMRLSRPLDRDFFQTPSIRSEEHTSELQSLMRISYAVFCLKKKKNINDKITNPSLLL